MSDYIIQREPSLADCTYSKQYDATYQYVCDLLEPSAPFAPALGLHAGPYLSPKHGYVVPCYRDIPGHSFIEQHPGNDEFDTEDCQLPGTDRGHLVVGGQSLDAVLHSRQTFVTLMHTYGFTDYSLGVDGQVLTDLTTQAALDAWVAAHPRCAGWTVDVLPPVGHV